MVFSDMKFLLELLEPSEQNQTKFLQLQSVLDYNNVTVETVMRRVSCSISTNNGMVLSHRDTCHKDMEI